MFKQLLKNDYFCKRREVKMSKSAFEKAIEKQRKEEQKAARQAQLRDRASAIISGTEIINGFRIMDRESETMLQAVLNQYDGNSNNYIDFDVDKLPHHLQESFSLECEKLQMYGMLSNVDVWISGTAITLSESGKKYFADKENVYKEAKEKQEREEELLKKDSFTRKKYDVFISHANRDKSEYVDLLNMSVKRLGINVFYDTDVLSWGDNWKQVILDGTSDSEFAIIIISKNFFGREWTEKELDEFLTQQNESGQKIVLPLLYGVSLKELKEHYPQLGDIQCISSDDYDRQEITILLAKELIKRYKNK